jgi:hypothetical protein
MLEKIKIHALTVQEAIIKIAIVKELVLNVRLELTRKKKDQKPFKLAFLFAVLELIHQQVLFHVSSAHATHSLLNHPLLASKIVKLVRQTLSLSNHQLLESTSVVQSVLLELIHLPASLHARHVLTISINKCQE